jgi:hypothetical protein
MVEDSLTEMISVDPLDRRTEQRLSANERVVATLLVPGFSTHARIVDLSGGGLGMITDEPLPVGSLIKIEGSDRLLSAEVVHCRPREDDSAKYTAGLRIAHLWYRR